MKSKIILYAVAVFFFCFGNIYAQASTNCDNAPTHLMTMDKLCQGTTAAAGGGWRAYVFYSFNQWMSEHSKTECEQAFQDDGDWYDKPVVEMEPSDASKQCYCRYSNGTQDCTTSQ